MWFNVQICPYLTYLSIKKEDLELNLNPLFCEFYRRETLMSGWRDLNSRPPAPKAGALTGLRYTPKFIWVTDGTRTHDSRNHNPGL